MGRRFALFFSASLSACTSGQKAAEKHESPDSDLALATNGGGCYPTDVTDHALGQVVLVNPEWAPVVNGKAVATDPVLVHGRAVWMHGDTGGDFPATHASSDYNVGLELDPEDSWRLGTGNLSHKTPTLDLEWEADVVPAWAWAGEGDRVVAFGRWIFDCGHPDRRPRKCTASTAVECTTDDECRPPACPSCAADERCDRPHYGYSTELHPPHATAVIREGRGATMSIATSAKDAVPATRADVFVSANGGGAGDKCVLTHQMDESDVIFNADCFPLKEPLANINAQDFVFDLPLPPRPSPDAKAWWRQIAHDEAGAIVQAGVAVTSKEDDPSPQFEVRVRLTEPRDGKLPTGHASTFFAGWSAPPAKPLSHVRVTIDSISIMDALRPQAPVVREIKRWHGQVSVNGEWQAFELDQVEAQKTYNLALVFDQWIPADGEAKLVLNGVSRACIDTLFAKSLKQTIAELGLQDAINCLETSAEKLGEIEETHDGPTFGAGPGEMAYESEAKGYILKYRISLLP
jgi:hypothetical protein